MANSVDPDQTPRSAASDLGLHGLFRPGCPNTLGYYSNIKWWVANSADPDQTPRSAASDLGLDCLLRPVCPNI